MYALFDLIAYIITAFDPNAAETLAKIEPLFAIFKK